MPLLGRMIKRLVLVRTVMASAILAANARDRSTREGSVSIENRNSRFPVQWRSSSRLPRYLRVAIGASAVAENGARRANVSAHDVRARRRRFFRNEPWL